MDKLELIISQDARTIPEFVNTCLSLHKEIYKNMQLIFLSIKTITDKKRNKMVFLKEDEIESLIDNIMFYLQKIYSFMEPICVDVDNYIYERIQFYKEICLENEYYEYMKSIDSIIKLYVL